MVSIPSETTLGIHDWKSTYLRGPRPLRRIVLLAIVITTAAVWHIRTLGHVIRQDLPHILSGIQESSDLPCRSLAGSEETLVILRTGSTELQDRFPVHIATSLRCFPHYLIFSDVEEHYMGVHILDALESVSPEIREEHQDFDLYRRLQLHGRAGLDPSELSGAPEAFARSSGNAENPGWKLDKWKFMPMVNRTFHEYPNMKWYVFMEADGFILWSMVQQYLATLDPSKAIFAGHQMFAGSELFAHGGAGFVASQPAMRMVVEHYSAHKHEIEAFTDGHWAGDCVLGKYFRESGVTFKNAFPHFQGDFPGLVAYAGPDGRSEMAKHMQERCYPTVSYHHMAPEMITDLWRYEQQWMSEHDAYSETLRHWDVFQQFVRPQMMAGKLDWDNLSDNEEANVQDMEACRAKCLAKPDCRQYSFRQEPKLCRTRVDPRLGKPANGTQSDWIQDRILRFEQDMAPCDTQGWT